MSGQIVIDDGELRRWAAALRGMAAPVVAGDDVRRPFVDEMGHRRAVDGPFLAWCGRARGGEDEGDAGAGCASRVGGLDVALWMRVRKAGRGTAWDEAESLAIKPDGSLTAREDFTGIEVWTETELSALHALSWLALLSGREAAWARMMDAARWHVLHTQPDNGTGHPWGLHVFLWLSREASVEGEFGQSARAYAGTLLSNCQVGLGRPDLFSAYVLVDAAAALERQMVGDGGRPAGA